jgi:hypothetical protein
MMESNLNKTYFGKGLTMSLNVIITALILVILVFILLILVQQGVVQRILGIGGQESLEYCNTARATFCSGNPKYCWDTSVVEVPGKNITCAQVYGRVGRNFYYNCSSTSLSDPLAWRNASEVEECRRQGGIGP